MLSFVWKKNRIALPYQSNKNDVGLKIEGICVREVKFRFTAAKDKGLRRTRFTAAKDKGLTKNSFATYFQIRRNLLLEYLLQTFVKPFLLKPFKKSH